MARSDLAKAMYALARMVAERDAFRDAWLHRLLCYIRSSSINAQVGWGGDPHADDPPHRHTCIRRPTLQDVHTPRDAPWVKRFFSRGRVLAFPCRSFLAASTL